MTRVHVFCEGQAEETFVREVLAPALALRQVYLNPIVFLTSRGHRGGVVSYGKVKWQLDTKCKEDPEAWVTTLIDFYGLPSDFPGVNLSAPASSLVRAHQLTAALQADIGHRNFISYLQVHEFEALLFSAPSAFSGWFPEAVAPVTSIRQSVKSPEDINQSPQTAPSKRILNLCPGYKKPLHGSRISLDIGLDVIRRECPIFDAWVKRLDAL